MIVCFRTCLDKLRLNLGQVHEWHLNIVCNSYKRPVEIGRFSNVFFVEHCASNVHLALLGQQYGKRALCQLHLNSDIFISSTMERMINNSIYTLASNSERKVCFREKYSVT